jgi:SnoaL-like domain
MLLALFVTFYKIFSHQAGERAAGRSVPSAGEPGRGEPHMLDLAQMRAFAERYTAAWCSQNAASVAAFYSPGGSLRINEDDPAVGRRAITAAAQGFMTAFPDMRVQMADIAVLPGGAAVYRWILTGTNTGPGGTGKRVHLDGFEEWEVGADGLIARSLGHFDKAEYQRQLQQGMSGPR